MSLSTAQPAIGGSAPALPTKIVRFKRMRPVRSYGAKRKAVPGMSACFVALISARFLSDEFNGPNYRDLVFIV